MGGRPQLASANLPEGQIGAEHRFPLRPPWPSGLGVVCMWSGNCVTEKTWENTICLSYLCEKRRTILILSNMPFLAKIGTGCLSIES